MKKYFLFCLLCSISFKIFAQEDAQSALPTTGYFKTYCYVNGVRLDSIDSRYATLSQRASGLILFDYGQVPDSKKTTVLTDSKNVLIYFTRINYVFALNLLYYNGWEAFITLSEGAVQGSVILKKRTQSAQ